MLPNRATEQNPEKVLGTLSGVLLAAVFTSVILATRRRGGRVTPVPQPGTVRPNLKEQISMAQFAYTFNLPAPANISDVARRKLVAAPAPGQESGKTVSVDIADPSAATSPELVLNVGVTYAVTLTDFDQAGNASAPSEPYMLSVFDDVAPAQPQQVGEASKRQVDGSSTDSTDPSSY